MIGIDVILSAAASVTAIIASLQAASRARYLLEHGQIGIKEGPLILPPHASNNESSSLWDVVQVFQQSVELSLIPLEDIVITSDQQSKIVTHPALTHLQLRQSSSNDPTTSTPQAYSLSPFPKPHQKEELDQLVDRYIEEALHHPNKKERMWNKLSEKMQKSFVSTSVSVSQWKHATRYYFHRATGFGSKVDYYNDIPDDEPVDDDTIMDFALCRSQKIQVDTTNNDDDDDGADDNANYETFAATAEITAYAPETFAKLRSHFAITDDDFRRSILESGPYISFQSNSKGAARVGGVFFFTRDGAFMIKTIKSGEAETFIKMLPKYYRHMKRYRRHSLLTRFCGMYRVQLKDAYTQQSQHYTFVIMNSVFPAGASEFISELYDLKGSTVGRECSLEEKKKKGPNAVLKDLDLKRDVELVRSFDNNHHRSSSSDEYGIHLGVSTKSKLMAQLRKDVALLQDCRVMDYSLLVGIVNMDLPEASIDAADVNAMELSIHQEKSYQKTTTRSEKLFHTVMTPIRLLAAPPLFFTRQIWSGVRGTMTTVLTYPLPHYGAATCVVDGGALSVLHGTRNGKRAIYYLGLIDFLQPWTARKVAEKQLKGILGYDTSAISCVDPDEYALRFLDFMDAHVS